ncbi:hypothetical protein [Bacillus sp. 3255]|uniref:hypothetical protein n=1 Tax=Bacillus sp. 3255 TaxID=2817904 RepID=UPI0028631613|nr:hypothetical protein [Bacillus sp. 3255]MDR6883118.1 hypothetical protein [Bacillus sp. 3255]
MKKYIVSVEFIEKSNGIYYPVDSIYEGNAQRCNDLRELGYLGEEVKEQKSQQRQETSNTGKGPGRGGVDKNESPRNDNEDDASK